MLGVRGTLADLKRYLRLNVFSLNTRLWLSALRPRCNLVRISLKLAEGGARGRGGRGAPQDQASLIRRRGFDALVVLDACRYDVFSEVVYRYLDGELKPAVSPGSTTVGWLKGVWGDRSWDDTVYVSASPLVNKRGLLEAFDARGRFLDVVEVWDWGWDERLCTVPPREVNLAVRIALAKARLRGLAYPGDCKLVVHYVQPHSPYVALRRVVAKVVEDERLSERITDVAVRKLRRFAGDFSIDYVLLGLLKDVLKEDEKVRRALRNAYRRNLEWVLEHVAELSTHLAGRVVVTSDHGELLGEYGLYFHPDLPSPVLRTVPWFVVR